MIPCKHCNTLNSLDSTFCKRCGTGLPEAEVEAGRTKLEALVQDGMHALNEGRINEAMAVAETAVVADPSMVSAFALKAAVHERKGEVVEALECAEKIVELNPDSELDKIKRNQLRASLGAQALSASAPNPVIAWVAATSVVVILVSAAVLATRFVDRPQPEVRLASNAPTNAPRDDQVTIDPRTTPNGPASNPGQVSSANPAPGESNSIATTANPGKAGSAGLPSSSQDSAEDQDTTPTRSAPQTQNPTELSIKPMPVPNLPADPPPSPILGTNPSTTPTQPSKQSVSSDPPPVAEITRSGPSTQNQPVDPGHIEITVHGGPASTPTSRGGGGASAQTHDASKIFLKMATDSQLSGNYGQAAQHYEKALSNGGDPVTVNERLGQSYANLGRKEEAVSAYKRAIAACSNALNAGRGDSAKIRAVRDECETAVRQIQGS
jgi:Tfp pilus assembly protein PilF